MSASLNRRPYLDALVILAYAGLTLLLTYPLIENFTTHVLGRDDVYLSMWDLWWAKKALWDLHTSPYFTQYMFHPIGVNLALHSLDLCNGILSIPLQMFFPLGVVYNVLMLAGFVISGYGMYLLAKYLTGDARASFVSGIIFAFCPYRFAHILGGHLDVVSIQFIPFYVLYLLKTEREGGLRNATLAAIFLAAASLCCWHYLVFMAAFTAVFMLHRIWFEREKTVAVLRKLSAFFLVFGVIILPFAYPIIADSLFGNYKKVPFEWSVTFSADLFSYLVPTLHPLLSAPFEGISRTFSGNIYESSLFVGYSVILLAIYHMMKQDAAGVWASEGFAKAKAILSNRTAVLRTLFVVFLGLVFYYGILGPDFGLYIILSGYSMFFLVMFYAIKERRIGFWLLSTVVFFVLSLGPLLHVSGTIYPLPLPYVVAPFMPILSSARDPTRFGIVVMLSLAVIAAYSLKGLLEKTGRKNLFTAGVALIIVFEFLAVPCVLADLRLPAFYAKLAEEKGDFAILEVPVPRTTGLYYQTQHEKRIVGGYIAIYPKGFYAFNQNMPAIPGFLLPVLLSSDGHTLSMTKEAYYRPDPAYDGLLEEYFSGRDASAIGEFGPLYSLTKDPSDATVAGLAQSYPQGDIIKQNISEIGAAALWHYDIRYVIIHDDELGTAEKKAVDMLLAEVFPGKQPFYAGDGMRVYRTPEAYAPFAVLGGGWFSKEPLEHEAARWMGGDASIRTVDWNEGPAQVSFEAKSLEAPRRLEVYVNGRLAGEYLVNQSYSAARLDDVFFGSGENIIVFHTSDGCTPQRNGFRTIAEDDVRCASLAFRKIRIVGGK